MQLPTKYTTISAWPLSVARALRAANIEPEPVFSRVGLSLTALEKAPDSRVTITTMTQFWQEVESVTKTPAFGLNVGQFAYPMHFRALGRMMMNSATLSQAIEKIPHYHAIISNSASIKLQRAPHLLGFTINPLNGVTISDMAIDAFFATLIQHGDLMLGHSRFVHSVDLRRAQPKDPRPWQERFACPVRFGQQENCLWMHKAMLEESVINQNAHIAALNETQVRNYLNKTQSLSWREKTSQAIHARLYSGDPTLFDAARVYNLSERTLSRYLKQEGTSFRELLQEKRKELAHHYLRNTAIPVTHVADKLGYACVSNFIRVFHRWYGVSPSVYRNKS